MQILVDSAMIDAEKSFLMHNMNPSDDFRQAQAFRRKYKTENPNCYLIDKKLTVFEKILRTPDASDDIEWCIKHGAKLYAVRKLHSKLQNSRVQCLKCVVLCVYF